MAKECASTMFPYCDEHLYGIQSSCHHPIMNPIIVNNESYCQFTMNAIASPSSAAVALWSAWDCRRKKVTMGKDARGMQAPKGMVCLQIERLSPSINQRIASAQRPLGTENQARPQRTHPKRMEQLGWVAPFIVWVIDSISTSPRPSYLSLRSPHWLKHREFCRSLSSLYRP